MFNKNHRRKFLKSVFIQIQERQNHIYMALYIIVKRLKPHDREKLLKAEKEKG